jgi:5-methylthioribose kinase
LCNLILIGIDDENDIKMIKYIGQQQDNKLVYKAELINEANTRVIVKFTKRYNLEIHKQFADMNLAPKLIGYDFLYDNEWKLIVMEDLTGNEWTNLKELKGNMTTEQIAKLSQNLKEVCLLS